MGNLADRSRCKQRLTTDGKSGLSDWQNKRILLPWLAFWTCCCCSCNQRALSEFCPAVASVADRWCPTSCPLCSWPSHVCDKPINRWLEHLQTDACSRCTQTRRSCRHANTAPRLVIARSQNTDVCSNSFNHFTPLPILQRAKSREQSVRFFLM